MTSDVSARSRALVEERLPEARGLGIALADLIDDPEAFVATLRAGLQRLADEPYAVAQERIVPGVGPVIGVRWPLVDAVARQLRAPLRESSPASAVWLAQRLATEDEQEMRLFSHVPLARSLPDDPERSWQLIRRLARAAHDWVAVDSLAHVVAQGILAEPFRWAELEQLVYSADRWERRLAGSTIATIPFRLPGHRRRELSTSPGLMIIKSLLGDAESDVQKALSWALRSWYRVDEEGVREFIRAESEHARATDDGHRAWVLRDALTLPAHDRRFVAEIRAMLDGIRRRADAPSTSGAGEIAAGFVGLEALSDRAIGAQGERQQLARMHR